MEYRIERMCCELAKRHGVLNLKIAKRGYPDRLFFGRSKFAFVEFKTHKGVLSLQQKHVIFVLAQHGIEVQVITTVEQFKRLLVEEFGVKQHQL